MPHVLYRVVETDPPTLNDFLSDRATGRRARLPDETDEEWDSFSAYTSLGKARAIARFLKQRRGLLALHLARLDIPDDSHVQVFPYRGSRSHVGVRGDPEALLGFARVIETA